MEDPNVRAALQDALDHINAAEKRIREAERLRSASISGRDWRVLRLRDLLARTRKTAEAAQIELNFNDD